MARRLIGLLVITTLLLLLASLASAQAPTNVLSNGGLEEDSFGPYSGRRGGEFPIYLPNGWNYWFGPQNGDRINVADKIAIRPHPGPGPDVKEGRRALNIDCGFYICTVAIYQQVGSVQVNTPIQASAFSQVKACNPAPNATSCGSAIESGAQTRIGIDPNGGTNPTDSDIVWSSWVQPHDQWLQMSVSATATGNVVTLFLYSTQSSVANINKTYWDGVILTGGGVGGVVAPQSTLVPPTATPIPYVNFVVPQAPQADGSIVHIVQAGDTMDSIAFAYSVTRTRLMELNNIGDPRLIYPGQKLLVKEAESPTVPPPTEPPAVALEPTLQSPPTSPAVQPNPPAPGARTFSVNGITFAADPALAANVNFSQFAGDPPSQDQPGGPQPAYTEFLLYNQPPAPQSFLESRVAIRVYRVNDLASYPGSNQQIQTLNVLLADRPDLIAFQKPLDEAGTANLPFLPVLPAAQVIRARAAYVETAAVRGISFVTAYRQDASPFLDREFLYTFQGVSTDGQFYVSVIAPLRIGLFPAQVPADFNPEAFANNLTFYLATSIEQINAATAADFDPALDQINAIVASMSFANLAG